MRIGAINNNYSFSSAKKPQKNLPEDDKNPISKTGEKTNLAVATFVGGLGVGARCLWYLFDDGFLWEDLGNAANKYVNKNHKGLSSNKKLLYTLGVAASFAAVFIGGVALLYTIYKAPKINYEGNVNAFTKGKDMDVYIKGNKVEKELLTQMNEKAKNGDEEEKQKLKEQYMQMRAAKNRVADFLLADKKLNLPAA